MMRSPSANPIASEPPAGEQQPVAFRPLIARLEQQVARGDLSPAAALERVAAELQLLTSADGVAIAVSVAESGIEDSAMVCRASLGVAPDVGAELQPDSGLSGECMRSAQPMLTADAQNDPRVDAAAAAALDVRSILILPLKRAEKVVGLLELFDRTPDSFDERLVAALQPAAELLPRLFSFGAEGASGRSLNGAGNVEAAAEDAASAHPEQPQETVVAPPASSAPEPQAARRDERHLFDTLPSYGAVAADAATGRSGRRVGVIAAVLFLPVLLLFAWDSLGRPGGELLAREQNSSAAAYSGEQSRQARAAQDAEALFRRALQAERGEEGAAADCSQAINLFRRAAHAGHLAAQYELGLRYKRAECGPEDAAGAARWWARAAERGHVPAQRAYAAALVEGSGVPRDRVSAYAWYVLAQQAGDDQSEQEIRELTRQMSDSEILRVRTRLGTMYAQGTGTSRDYVRAYTWFTLAELGGDPAGARLRQDVSKLMSAEQVQEARRRAAEWLRRHPQAERQISALPATAQPEGERRAESGTQPQARR